MTEQERIELVGALKIIQSNCEKYSSHDCKGCWFKTIRGTCEFQDGWSNLPFRNINDAEGSRPLGEASYGKLYKVEKDVVIHKKEVSVIYGCDGDYVPKEGESVQEFDYQNADCEDLEKWTFSKYEKEGK